MDRDTFLDKLWDWVFPNEDDEDPEFFEHLTKFFDQMNEQNSGGNNTNTNTPRRRRQSASAGNTGTSRRRSRANAGAGYGSSAWFGSNT